MKHAHLATRHFARYAVSVELGAAIAGRGQGMSHLSEPAFLFTISENSRSAEDAATR